jgi:hypothetical protein
VALLVVDDAPATEEASAAGGGSGGGVGVVMHDDCVKFDEVLLTCSFVEFAFFEELV